MTRLLSALRAWRHRRRFRRDATRLDRLLKRHGVVLHRYTDDSLAWLDVGGTRFYFEGTTLRQQITTYVPDERTRTLLTTKYR
jgi:hypothetical protein